jgi:hypothetical protein
MVETMAKKLATFQEDTPRARIEPLALPEITCDSEILPRGINFTVVTEYAEAMQSGDVFPPLAVVQDGTTYLLVDGLQRLEAARQNGLKTIQCAVRKGTRRDAILASCAVNATHGLPRTWQDKRCAVLKLLTDSQWKRWSDREIARQCRVSHPFVKQQRDKLRVEEQVASVTAGGLLTGNVASDQPRVVRLVITKHGNQTEMDVSKIGRSPINVEAEAKAWSARRTEQHFRETLERLRSFEEHRVLENPDMAVEVLMKLPGKDDLGRIIEAVRFIQEALDRIGPHEVIKLDRS